MKQIIKLEEHIRKYGFNCLVCGEFVRPYQAILLYKLNYRLECEICEMKDKIKELNLRVDINYPGMGDY